MTARLLRVVLGGVTLAASGTYTFVYLYRWEWNRALISAAIFIAAEVAVIGWLLAHRIRVVSDRLDTVVGARHGSVLRTAPSAGAPVPVGIAASQRRQRIHETAPPPRASFAWLARPERMNVFVPVLLGAGVVLSGLAWVVERVARHTMSPVAERGLAARLDGLSLPADGFVGAERAPLDLLRRPVVEQP
jgi:hypothetical protein